MKRFPRLLLLLLTMALCLSMFLTGYAVNGEGVTFSAELSEKELPYSEGEQTVSIILAMSKAHLIDSAEYHVVSNIPGFRVSEPENVPDGIATFDTETKVFAWMANNDVSAETLGTYTVTIPAGTKAGSYSIGFEEIMLSADFTYWEEGGKTSAVLTIIPSDSGESAPLPGDLNDNGKLDREDMLLLFLRISVQTVENETSRLDVNGDGKANNRDVILLFRRLAGQEESP